MAFSSILLHLRTLFNCFQYRQKETMLFPFLKYNICILIISCLIYPRDLRSILFNNIEFILWKRTIPFKDYRVIVDWCATLIYICTVPSFRANQRVSEVNMENVALKEELLELKTFYTEQEHKVGASLVLDLLFFSILQSRSRKCFHLATTGNIF